MFWFYWIVIELKIAGVTLTDAPDSPIPVEIIAGVKGQVTTSQQVTQIHDSSAPIIFTKPRYKTTLRETDFQIDKSVRDSGIVVSLQPEALYNIRQQVQNFEDYLKRQVNERVDLFDPWKVVEEWVWLKFVFGYILFSLCIVLIIKLARTKLLQLVFQSQGPRRSIQWIAKKQPLINTLSLMPWALRWWRYWSFSTRSDYIQPKRQLWVWSVWSVISGLLLINVLFYNCFWQRVLVQQILWNIFVFWQWF